MIFNGIIEGKTVNLRSVSEKDAEFILQLRVDQKTGKFLCPTENNLQGQVEWIRRQIESDFDYYFLISSKNGSSLGTIGLYNLKEEQGEFGRWICIGNAIEAIESVILIHDFGFYSQGLKIIYSTTNSLNQRVMNFNKNFGANFTNQKIVHRDCGIIMEEAMITFEEYPLIRRKNMSLVDKLT